MGAPSPSDPPHILPSLPAPVAFDRLAETNRVLGEIRFTLLLLVCAVALLAGAVIGGAAR